MLTCGPTVETVMRRAPTSATSVVASARRWKVRRTFFQPALGGPKDRKPVGDTVAEIVKISPLRWPNAARRNSNELRYIHRVHLNILLALCCCLISFAAQAQAQDGVADGKTFGEQSAALRTAANRLVLH